jgi:hypothetical protein
MKRTFTFLLIFLFAATLSAQVTEFTYHFDQPETSVFRSNQIINFPNTMLQGKPGEPMMPYHAVNLLIPPGHEAISISVTGTGEVFLTGNYKLPPAQFSRPISIPGFIAQPENEEVYNSSDIYPSKLHGNLSTHYMNGYAYAQSVFTPVRYIPAEGKISFFSEITIRIETRETTRGREALKNLSSSAALQRSALKNAQNPEMASVYSSPRASATDYQILIITPQPFTATLNQLAQLYLPAGLKSQIATIEFIQANIAGLDLPEKIRNYIIQQYQQNGIEHVVLAGDVEHVPYRGFYCSVQSSSVYTDTNIPSDLYYSALDGNWNTNGNNLWGEIGEDDLLPEVSVGRMSFSNSTELAAMLNKTTKYQNEPVLGELRNPLLAGENLYYNPDTWGSDYLELLIGTHNENGYTTTGIPENHNFVKLYDEIEIWDKYSLMATINAGRNFIHHVGHANQDYVMKLNMWDITNSNFSGVNGTTHNFPVVYTHGCICGAFDVSDCIGEKMVSIENFAAAFVGNSRYGWFNEGQTEGPSAHLHREFTDALFADSLNRIGRAHMESKAATAPWVNAPGQWEEGALRWCFYDCNVLGDPMMAIWTNEPIAIATAYPATITTGTPQFEVTVTTGGQPAKGLTAALLMNGTIFGKGITGNNGTATVVIDPLITTPGNAQLVISGYNCLPVYYPIAVVSGNSPYVVYFSHQIIDNQGNNNGLADYGETIDLSLTVENIGLADATDVTVTISTTDQYITFTDNEESYGLIAAGENKTTEGFTFEVSPDVPDNRLVEFTVSAESEGEIWISSFTINMHAPVISAGSAVVDDASGNNNHIPDPGEIFNLNISVLNTGHSNSLPLTGTLSCNSSYVTPNFMEAGPYVIDLLSETMFEFQNIELLQDTPHGTPLIFTFSVTTGDPPIMILEQEYAFVAGQIIEDFESGNFLMHPWLHSGHANWTVTDASSFEQNYSARSGIIGHNQLSQLEVNYKVLADDSISFYLKASSEAGYDFLMFYINDVKKGQWSGEQDWMRVSYPVSEGNQTFKWTYSKDMSATGGQDAAWIDYIIFPPVEIGVGNVEILLNNTKGMYVFPNPAKGTAMLYTGKTEKNAVIQLTDISGRLIKSFDGISTDQFITLDLSGIRAGIYFIRNAGQIPAQTIKIIIQ